MFVYWILTMTAVVVGIIVSHIAITGFHTSELGLWFGCKVAKKIIKSDEYKRMTKEVVNNFVDDNIADESIWEDTIKEFK